jgi:prepilin-type N-terminal cleavage/methylation domain-containing protein
MRHYSRHLFSQGFTLIELSIVIVIIGLIVAGVVGGQQLVKSAKLRTVMQDVNNYTTANHTFFLKYNEYAGDMLDANTNAYWGIDNPDGDYTVPGDRIIVAKTEGIRSWHHLKLAGILDGNYDGEYIANEVPGITVGKSGYADNVGFLPHTLGNHHNEWWYSTGDVYDMRGLTVFHFGKTGYLIDESALSPKEAYNIDLKYDDGLPNKGKTLADHGRDVGSDNQCINYNKYANGYNASSDDGIAYKLDNTGPRCRMMFIFR